MIKNFESISCIAVQYLVFKATFQLTISVIFFH